MILTSRRRNADAAALQAALAQMQALDSLDGLRRRVRPYLARLIAGSGFLAGALVGSLPMRRTFRLGRLAFDTTLLVWRLWPRSPTRSMPTQAGLETASGQR